MYGKIIKYYRCLRGLTQAQLADEINVSEKTISSWEVNRTQPNMEGIESLSLALGVPKSKLVGEELTSEKLSATELALLTAYRCASKDTRAAVDAILRIK